MSAAVLSILLASSAFGAESWTPQLGKVTGTVVIYAKGSDEGLPAEDGTLIEEGDRIETGDDSRAELALHKGSVMELGAGSSMTVESLKKAHSWFDFHLGSFIAKFEKFAAKQRASVRTPTSVAAVRGTEFGVEVAEDGETAIGVFDEGRVSVQPSDAEGVEETFLEKQQELVIAPEGAATVSKGGKRFLRAQALERFEGRREHLERVRGRREQIRKAWRDIPHERRQQMREKWRDGMREKVRNMPPEQRQRLKEGFQRRHEGLERRRAALEQLRGLPPEQKRQLGEKVRENIRRNWQENGQGGREGKERGGGLREKLKDMRQERREDRREERRGDRREERRGQGPGGDEQRRKPGFNPGGPGGPGGGMAPGRGPGGGSGGGPGQNNRSPGGRRDEQRGGGPGRR